MSDIISERRRRALVNPMSDVKLDELHVWALRYCKCEMPYNPDDLMVQCEGCKDRYHPACVGMTTEEAKKLDHFVCAECSSDGDVKKSQNGFATSPAYDVKVETKRRKR